MLVPLVDFCESILRLNENTVPKSSSSQRKTESCLETSEEPSRGPVSVHASIHEDTCEKKDLKTCKDCEHKGIKGSLCYHDFRHTAITNMRKAGVNISVIMAISGHRSAAMFERYNRIDLSDGREAMQRLERYLSETGIQGKQGRNEKKENQRTDNDYCNITAAHPNGEIAYA